MKSCAPRLVLKQRYKETRKWLIGEMICSERNYHILPFRPGVPGFPGVPGVPGCPEFPGVPDFPGGPWGPMRPSLPSRPSRPENFKKRTLRIAVIKNKTRASNCNDFQISFIKFVQTSEVRKKPPVIRSLRGHHRTIVCVNPNERMKNDDHIISFCSLIL